MLCVRPGSAGSRLASRHCRGMAQPTRRTADQRRLGPGLPDSPAHELPACWKRWSCLTWREGERITARNPVTLWWSPGAQPCRCGSTSPPPQGRPLPLSTRIREGPLSLARLRRSAPPLSHSNSLPPAGAPCSSVSARYWGRQLSRSVTLAGQSPARPVDRSACVPGHSCEPGSKARNKKAECRSRFTAGVSMSHPQLNRCPPQHAAAGPIARTAARDIKPG